MKYLESHGPWRFVLVGMLAPLALVAFWPSPVDTPVQGQLTTALQFLHTHGVPAWFNYQLVEAMANVVLFVPLGVVAVLAFPKKYWWQIGILGLIVSGCIEMGQLLFLHNRFASPVDLVTNTGGAVIGSQMVMAARNRVRAHRLSEVGP